MEDGIYVPMSDRTLRKLEQLVLRTGFDEDTVVSAALELMLRKTRQSENDNEPLSPGALPPIGTHATGEWGRPAIGLSPPEMPAG